MKRKLIVILLPPCIDNDNTIMIADEESKNSNEPSPLKKLCEKLCNEDCKSFQDMEDIKTIKNDEIQPNSSKFITKSLLKVPSKIDLERKKFLDEILKDVDLDKIANIDFDTNENETNIEQQELINENDNKINKEINLNEKIKYNLPMMGINTFHEKFKIADALARTSMMTSPAAKRRLAARKIEMELDFGRMNTDSSDFVPPRDLLLYLVRMGSFNSAPKINNSDTQDDNLIIPNGLNCTELIKHCKALRGENRPQLLKRQFINPTLTADETDLCEGFNHINLTNPITSKNIGKILKSSPHQIRVFQWNILSQSLGQKNDGFVCCPDEALTWDNRKFLIIEEILQNDPDIICLQEVDHFKFLERILGSQNYCGIFFPKPDSPCLYIEENNGPDGCAIFYKRDKFNLLNYDTRILEVWHVQSNQVAIVANLKLKDLDKELTICTTHLKARNGALLSKLRNEQGKDLLKFINDVGGNRPVLLCGDFNAEPIEPVYNTVLNNRELELTSAYAEINKQLEELNDDCKIRNSGIDKTNNEDCKNLECNGDEELKEECNVAEIMAKKEPAYTTWKIREEGEICHTIDYVFFSKNHFRVQNCLLFPKSEEIGEHRTPSFRYPSDHFSLVCDFEFLEENSESSTKSSEHCNNISNNN
ncbi:nocturnin isoform X2 [Condylostylus longicornis]|uniref:nocturnin isoform X2 n=1 Tax=Condylostylus longicornis TaxID=2530218 RepID=UPI00244DE6A0|nr:nocturnin isoform X2 [Condylostylus longicornis]